MTSDKNVNPFYPYATKKEDLEWDFEFIVFNIQADKDNFIKDLGYTEGRAFLDNGIPMFFGEYHSKPASWSGGYPRYYRSPLYVAGICPSPDNATWENGLFSIEKTSDELIKLIRWLKSSKIKLREEYIQQIVQNFRSELSYNLNMALEIMARPSEEN